MVVNNKWIMEDDYTVYPKEKWCDMDYMAMWIRGLGYKPTTSMENLIDMVFAHYYGYLEDNKLNFYTDIKWSENGLMVSINDVSCFVEDNGGLREFDYYC